MLNNFLHDYKNVFNSNPFYLIKRYLFLTIYGIFKYLPTPIGDVLRAAWLKLFFKRINTIWVREGVTFHFGENISIGNSVIGEFTYFNGYGGIDIGDKVLIGAYSMFYSHDHNFNDLTKPIWHQGLKKKPIIIKDNVFIGCNVVVLGGVTINEGAVIGAGSVVVSDVPQNAIVAGVPAKVIGERGGESKLLSQELQTMTSVSSH